MAESIPYKYLRRRDDTDDKVWLSSSFRVQLIKRGIEKAGSINQLGRELGYRSRVHPGWSVRQILLGNQPFPFDRLVAFAAFLDYPLDEILKHRIRSNGVTVNNTKKALENFGMRYFVD